MARLRLQYSIDEVITNLYTYGEEWMYEDTTEYIGPYHRYTTGEIYTGATWNNSKSKKLIEYQDATLVSYRYRQINDVRTNYNAFTNYSVEITNDDYATGHIIRYFIKKLNDGVITEISKLTYDDYAGSIIDPNLYNAIELKWIITGYTETTKHDGMTTIGVADQNRSTLLRAERNFSGIFAKLSNLLEFYTDMEYKTPDDINNKTRVDFVEQTLAIDIWNPSHAPTRPDIPIDEYDAEMAAARVE